MTISNVKNGGSQLEYRVTHSLVLVVTEVIDHCDEFHYIQLTSWVSANMFFLQFLHGRG